MGFKNGEYGAVLHGEFWHYRAQEQHSAVILAPNPE